MKKANFKKVTGKTAVSQILIPVGCAFLGSIAGAAAGKTANLAVAAALGVGAIAFGEPNLTYAAAGAAVVTPSSGLKGIESIDGLDGFSDLISGAKNRALGQAKSILSNAKLDVIADKLPVSGINGLDGDDAYDQGYIQGVNDAVDDQYDSAVQGIAGTYNPAAQLAAGAPERSSVEALKMQAMMA